MLTTMMTALFVSTIPGLGLRPGAVLQDPPVEVWLSKTDRLERGDRIRVHARADEDGYLLVLHAEPGGRIRVLFPLDPVDDDFIRAGDEYEIRGRGERAAFQVMESSGSGAVFAAFSRDPFRFDQLVRGDHWDYTLDTWAIGDDAEGDLVRLADLMSGGAAYEYDLVRYEVNGYVAHGRYGRRLGLYAGSSYGRSWFGMSWGDPYSYSSWYYRPYSYYRPYRYAYYDPWYDPYYEPYFPFWYDACWYGPCYYRAHYYGWYSPRYYYRDYYYSRGYYDYWHGGSAWRDGGRYTFKGSAVPRGIEPRSRGALAGAVTRRLLSPEDNRGGSIGRRTLGVNTVAQTPTNGGRRVFTNDGQGTPRTPSRVTSSTTTRQGAGTARTPGRVTTPAQPQTDAGRRGVQDPRRLAPDARERVPERQAEPRGESSKRELRDRMVQPQPQQKPQQRPQSETRETTRPRLERREPRESTAREAPRPRVEPRSSPPPRAEPRSSPPPRAVPRSSPPPRAEPRSSPPPRAAPAPRSGGSSVPRRRG